MILDYDENLEKLVESLTPRWTEIRVSMRDFSKLDEHSFVTGAILLVGERSLLCSMTSKEFTFLRIDYYPIYLKEVDQDAYASAEWITLARKGGTSEFERKIQWLFERPSMRLLISEEECADGMGPEAQQYLLRFYGGIALADPTHTKTMQVSSSEDPLSFTVGVRFCF